MVNKLVVVALVAILAVPILLGYGMNLTEETHTSYRAVGDSTNVTSLLQNGTGYSIAHADAAKLNINAGVAASSEQQPPIVYDSKSNNRSAYYAYQTQGTGTAPQSFGLSTFYYVIVIITGSQTYDRIDMTVTKSDSTTETLVGIHSVNYDDSTKILEVEHLNYINGSRKHTTYVDAQSIVFTKEGSYSGTWYGTWYYKNTTNRTQWVNIAGGFHYVGSERTWNNLNTWKAGFPNGTSSVLFTINLDSIADSNYEFQFAPYGVSFTIKKTTTNGVAAWELYENYHYPARKVTDLFYDPQKTDNTYQVSYSLAETGIINDQNDQYYDATIKLNYVGSWPTLIGAANPFVSYDLEWPSRVILRNFDGIPYVNFVCTATRSPTIRVDDAVFKAFEYPIIENRTLDPKSFKTNPSTALSGVQKVGQSIIFGGRTFSATSDGYIMMGTHKIPINSLHFESVPTDLGGYENRINGDVINTSAQPSSIVFNGQWSVDVSITSQESYTYTKTEWTPGQFAWDGLDQNFLMVGLLTSIGAFIALGIYARKAKAALFPLIVACGGAAALFFIML